MTLIEIIVLIAALGIACLGLGAALQQMFFSTTRITPISAATALAAGEAERISGLDFASVTDEHRGSPVSYAGGFSSYSWEVRVDSIDTAQSNLGSDPAMAHYKVVEIRIHHGAISYIPVTLLKTNTTF